MAKIDFPDNPTVDQEFVLDDNRTYIWDGTKWNLVIQGASPSTAAPTITIISETNEDVTFTLTNNDDNTAFITYEIDDDIAVIELAAAATSGNITVALAAGTYTLTAFATVVGEVASQSTAAVEIVVIPAYEELFSTTVATATTQIDITGLSIGKDDTLRLVYTLVGDSSSITGVYTIFANNNTTATNYHLQRLVGDGTTLFIERTNDSRFAFARNDAASGFIDMKVSNNDRFVAQSQHTFRSGAAASEIGNQNHNIIGTFTASSITQLTIVCNRTNGIAVNSKITLYKVTEAA